MSNTRISANSRDALVNNLMVFKAGLAPIYTDEEIKEFVLVLKKEMVKLGWHQWLSQIR